MPINSRVRSGVYHTKRLLESLALFFLFVGLMLIAFGRSIPECTIYGFWSINIGLAVLTTELGLVFIFLFHRE